MGTETFMILTVTEPLYTCGLGVPNSASHGGRLGFENRKARTWISSCCMYMRSVSGEVLGFHMPLVGSEKDRIVQH